MPDAGSTKTVSSCSHCYVLELFHPDDQILIETGVSWILTIHLTNCPAPTVNSLIVSNRLCCAFTYN